MDLKKIQYNNELFLTPLKFINQKLNEQLKGMRVGSNTEIADITSDINIAKDNFKTLSKFKKEKRAIDKQHDSLKKVLEIFNLKQKESMDYILETISENLNKFYNFMNSRKEIANIQITTAEDRSGEFGGIEFKLTFHGEETQLPKNFLSESQLNCLGLSLFLASAKIFNKESRFIVLDDVISSFDKNHRYRFCQLLLGEEFQDYQLIVLNS